MGYVMANRNMKRLGLVGSPRFPEPPTWVVVLVAALFLLTI